MVRKIKVTLFIVLLSLTSCDSSKTMNSYDSALKRAEQETKYVLLDFGATWCGGCEAFDKYVFDVSRIENKITENFVILKIDHDEPKNKYLVEKYKIAGLPHIVIINKDEKMLGGVLGFNGKYVEEPDLFISKLNEIIELQNKIRKLEESFNADSTNHNLLNDLLKEYQTAGQYFGVEKIEKLLVKIDPTPEGVFEYNFEQAVKTLENEINPEPLVTILSQNDSLDIKHKAIAMMDLLDYYESINDIKKQDYFYNKLLKINPGYFKKKYARFLFEHNMKIDSAIVLTNEILLDENYRNYHWGQFLKAHSLVFQGQKTRAINEYHNWMERHKNLWQNEEDYWPLYFYARFANYHNCDLKRALAYLKIGEEKRNMVEEKLLMAEILYKLGESKSATDKLTESLNYIDKKKENGKILALIEKYKRDL